MSESMIERVGEELRKECLAVFGSTWSNDVAWRFAAAAIEAMRTPTDAMIKAEAEYDHYEGNRGRLTHEAEEVWGVMIDAALKEQEGKKR